MEDFGVKVRELREIRGFTREIFCGDEEILSSRQLSRIETGKSIPNIITVKYIAERLGMSVSDLLADKNPELSDDYLSLKHKLLRIPTYGDNHRLELRELYFNQIYEFFYDGLPEDEKLVIDCLQSKLDVYRSGDDGFGLGLLQDYWYQMVPKEAYCLNNLIFLDLYLTCFAHKQNRERFYKEEQYDEVMLTLLNLSFFSSEEKCQLNNVLLNHINIAFELGRWDYVEQVLDKSFHLMVDTNDYQKRPIISLVEWKYRLYAKHSMETAQESYGHAVLFAQLMGEDFLKEKLSEEWYKDMAASHTFKR
ncbi:Cro/Cl family transcriptional regulator [Streptococcus sp. zg-JUN1979]|uniref:helix-turn-helix domain-containing protein n=1 Tax=Streptococcus sp. zg-JUN1979 TaxID=3391450 RepID=UPI0039A5194C